VADRPPAGPATHLDCRVDARDVELLISVPTGRRLAIVGPNGAGKSTALLLLAGHLRPDSGSVRLHGKTVSSPRTHVPAHRRRVVSLEQNPGLFPHLTVLDNVAYGPRARGLGRALTRARTELDAVGLAALASRRPHQLSGGQAQRVALARALAVDPDLILLDEPLAALDVEAAPDMRRVLADRLSGRTTVIVTHDPLDLWALADLVVVVASGRVVQSGTVEDVLSRPGSDFVARLSGVSLLYGTALDDGLRTPGGDLIGVRPPSGWRPGADAFATIDPRAVAVHVTNPCGTLDTHVSCHPANSLPARISSLTPAGALTRVTAILRDGQRVDAEITSRHAATNLLSPGVPVTLLVDASTVKIHPR